MNHYPNTVTDQQWSTRRDQEQAYRRLVLAIQEVTFKEFSDGVRRRGEAFYGVLHGILDGALNNRDMSPEGLYACYYYGTSKNRTALREALLEGLRRDWLIEGRIKDRGRGLPESLLTDEAALRKELDRYFYVYRGNHGYHAFRRTDTKTGTE